MSLERKRGTKYSGILHAALLFLLIFGLPIFFSSKKEVEPFAVTVDILPVATVSNVRPSDATPSEEQSEAQKKEAAKSAEAQKEPKKPAPLVKTAENTPPPPPEVKEEKKLDKKEEVKPKEEKKVEKKEEKKKEDPLDAILKGVKQTAQKTEEQTQKETKDEKQGGSTSRSTSTSFDPNSPEALSVRDAVANQVYKCWNIPAGAKNAEELIIKVNVDYDETGNPLRVELAEESKARYNSDGYYRAAADSARRAVRICAPLKNMPPNTHYIWKEVTITFNPSFVL